MTLGTYLKQQREKHNFTQVELGREFHYTKGQFISNIERGCAMPPLRVLKRWAQIIDADACKVKRLFLNKYKEQLDKVL